MESSNRFNLSGNPFQQEIIFSASRSSGPGGQHVNKVSTRVELRFNIPNSLLLSEEEKAILLSKLKNKINKEGDLILVSQEGRSQLKNKAKVLEKFYEMIEKALTPPKKRKATRPSKATKEKRLEEKKIISEKKSQRKKPEME